MQLSRRLDTLAKAVSPGHRIADIGTDHGFVPIVLVESGKCPGAIAADVHEGPLQRAKDHIKEVGLSDRIATKQTDGLDGIDPDDVDTVLIAGMGGSLMERILSDHPEFFAAGKEFVLSPQSEWFKIRKLLRRMSYRIIQEWFLFEDGKYYVVMKAGPIPDHDQISPVSSQERQDLEDLFGPYLLQVKDETLRSYMLLQRDKKKEILARLEREGVAWEKSAGLAQELRMVEKALAILSPKGEDKMRYCMECGTKLKERLLEKEGMVPYCEKCKTFRFPVFSTAVSMEVLNPARDKVLLIKQYGKDKYILVAGYVSKGENAEDTVVREVMEEVGLRVTGLHFEKSEYFAPSNTLMLNFSCVVESEDLSHIARDEIDYCRWFSFEEAKTYIAPGSLASRFLNRFLEKQEAIGESL